ncbi:CBS domain-containing protein [Klenkia terrae]|uniref:CBS domain-containing protein n=1 Tax=Klenkia terrae TaxID=1052259 RepID=UPI00360AD099
MSAPAVTVGPATPATYAAEVLASRGFAALPVVDTGDRLLGVVAEVDLVRDRIRPDPGCTPAGTSGTGTTDRPRWSPGS